MGAIAYEGGKLARAELLYEEAELAELAVSTGFVLWERAAQRIAATASAARSAAVPPDPRQYPALIYVDRPIPANR